MDNDVTLEMQQRQFAAYIRNPAVNPAPDDVDIRRMKVYRELFFNNVRNFLSDSFPVCRASLGLESWNTLIEGFFANHHSSTPHFPEIPEEFLTYLQELPESQVGSPFLLELAHYEWVEIALRHAFDNRHAENLQSSVLPAVTDCRLAVSELALVLAYEFPVHKISAENIPSEKSEKPTCLVVYRDREEQVLFLEISLLTFRMLDLLQNNGSATLPELMVFLSGELAGVDVNQLQQQAYPVMEDLLQRGVLIPSD